MDAEVIEDPIIVVLLSETVEVDPFDCRLTKVSLELITMSAKN